MSQGRGAGQQLFGLVIYTQAGLLCNLPELEMLHGGHTIDQWRDYLPTYIGPLTSTGPGIA